MVGRKVAIVSDKPQTTRRAIRGVRDRARPLPARAHRPARACSARATRSPSACSAAWRPSSPSPTPRCSCSTASRAWAGPGDRFIAEALAGAEGAGRDRRQQGRRDPPRPDRRRAAGRRRPRPGRRGVPDLRPHRPRRGASSSSTSPALLPEGPFYFPPEEVSDQSERVDARRAGPRAGAAPHPPGGPARRRGADRRARGARRADRRARVPVDGDRVPEGDPDRRARAR